MPAVSVKQRRAIAIAEHEPDKLYSKNKGLLAMSKSQLHDFAATPEKNLPGAHQAFRSSKPPRPESKIKTAMRQMMRKNGDARGGSRPGRNRD